MTTCVLVATTTSAQENATIAGPDFVVRIPSSWKSTVCPFVESQCYETVGGDAVVVTVTELSLPGPDDQPRDASNDAPRNVSNLFIRMKPANPTRDSPALATGRYSSRSLGGDRTLSVLEWRSATAGETRNSLSGIIQATRSLTNVNFYGQSSFDQLQADLDAFVDGIVWQ